MTSDSDHDVLDRNEDWDESLLVAWGRSDRESSGLSPALEDAVLHATLKSVRTRRLRSRGFLAAAGMFLFGFGFMARVVSTPTDLGAKNAGPSSTTRIIDTASAKDVRREAVTDEAASPELSPEEVEHRAEGLPHADAAAWWRRAGDAYLAWGDVGGALRCYRRLLDGREVNAGESSGIDGSETWLLAALTAES